MHALRALSQGAPAGRRVRRRDVLQKDDASRRRKETRPHEGKETVDNAGRKGRGRRPATTPEHRRGGCIRGRGAVDAEIESRRLATCPCGWHQEEPGGTRGHGPHPPLAMGHGLLPYGMWNRAPWACGALPQAHVIRVGISREGLGRCPRAGVPGRRSRGWGVPGEEANVLDCWPWAPFWRPIW